MDALREKPWILVVVVIVALAAAGLSAWRTMGPRGRTLSQAEIMAVRASESKKLQEELKQKYGIEPLRTGGPSATPLAGLSGGSGR